MGSAATLPTDRVLAQVAFDFRACALAISDSANVMRATLQQTYTLDDLAKRYHGHTRDQILALLATYAGYQPQRGRHAPIHLDQVLAIDAALRSSVAEGITR